MAEKSWWLSEVLMVQVTLVLSALLALAAGHVSAQQARPPLSADEVTAIAQLLRLEDQRRFDEPTLTRLVTSPHPEVRRRAAVTVGRVVNADGLAVLEPLKIDADPEIVATAAFAMGQLKNPAAIEWLTTTMRAWGVNPSAAFESARALGKIRSPEARTALEEFLASVPDTLASLRVVGEALLSLGRFTEPGDLAPLLKWTTASDVELRWRATWALFRPRNPAAIPHLLTLSKDPSPDVRFWAVRGLVPQLIDQLASPTLTRDIASARLREAVKDADRRVRTEALRVLTAYDDDASVAAVLAEVDNPDTWMSVSAVETLGRHKTRIAQVAPRLAAASSANRPLALRLAAIAPMVQLAPPLALETLGSLLGHPSVYARTMATQALRGMGPIGQQRLEAAATDPALKDLLIAAPTPGGRGAARALPDRPLEDYRRLVEQWIVPAYSGAASPRAVWTTSKGEIEIELFAADAPLGMEELERLTESGAIAGPVFSRLVPNFVAQQATIPGANRLRDEVNRHGLLRGNLAWASSGLDTGRPGYTLGNTPQPHNEGDFTSLGRVIRGMDAVDRLELGDAITAARIVK
jgi:HEAT repeat protein/cyclophilin family peptidyl-prolyl cis-trans isomerase